MKIQKIALKQATVIANAAYNHGIVDIDIDTNCIMPDTEVKEVFECILQQETQIQERKGTGNAKVKVVYLVSVDLQGEKYEQNLSDRIFSALQSVLIEKANSLLQGTEYPSIPMGIEVE